MVTFLTDSELRSAAPSIYAENPSERVSDRYSFLPTTRVLDILKEEGWEPWKASQVRSRSTGMSNTAKHLIRLRHEDLELDSEDTDGGLFPEIIVVNAHNGLAAYQLRAGVFRLVCSNGMVVAEREFAPIRIRHQAFEDSDVYEASRVFCENVTHLNSTLGSWRETDLDRPTQQVFAAKAARIRFTNPGSDIVDNVLTPRRSADTGSDLWSVFNRCQENLLQGGYLNTETRRRVRPIKSIQKDLFINSRLWELANTFAN